ncbi:hypothetical protein GVAV_000715 [Gurleya vavrai]
MIMLNSLPIPYSFLDNEKPYLCYMSCGGFNLKKYKIHNTKQNFENCLAANMAKKPIHKHEFFIQNSPFDFFNNKKMIGTPDEQFKDSLLLFVDPNLTNEELSFLYDQILSLKTLPNFYQTNYSRNILIMTKEYAINSKLSKIQNEIGKKTKLEKIYNDDLDYNLYILTSKFILNQPKIKGSFTGNDVTIIEKVEDDTSKTD